MYRVLVILITLLPLCLNAQNVSDKEIQFESDLTWEQVREKAKQEGKYIFVDYYATWCAPCKQMDKIVYTSSQVAKTVNEKFISVKVQMDTATRDSDQIKRWYSVARSFRKEYKIEAFPTYLFFSPNGEIVHRGSGFKMPSDFLKVLNDAIDSRNQLYTQLRNYKNNIKDYKTMPALAKNVYSLLNDKELAFEIANEYNKNYLNSLPKDQLLKRESIEFITWYPKLLKSGDKYFRLFLNDSAAVDSVVNQRGFSSKVIDGIITREEINPRIFKDGGPIKDTPDWKQLLNTIRKKYGNERAERNILNAQITWYSLKKKWDEAIKYNVVKIEKEGIDTSFIGRLILNNFCYDMVFKKCGKIEVLTKAINWMQFILKFDPNDASGIDTYANLLYKVGRVEEAINWQKKAVMLDPGSGGKMDALNKMKNRIPTWE